MKIKLNKIILIVFILFFLVFLKSTSLAYENTYYYDKVKNFSFSNLEIDYNNNNFIMILNEKLHKIYLFVFEKNQTLAFDSYNSCFSLFDENNNKLDSYTYYIATYSVLDLPYVVSSFSSVDSNLIITNEEYTSCYYLLGSAYMYPCLGDVLLNFRVVGNHFVDCGIFTRSNQLVYYNESSDKICLVENAGNGIFYHWMTSGGGVGTQIYCCDSSGAAEKFILYEYDKTSRKFNTVKEITSPMSKSDAGSYGLNTQSHLIYATSNFYNNSKNTVLNDKTYNTNNYFYAFNEEFEYSIEGNKFVFDANGITSTIINSSRRRR